MPCPHVTDTGECRYWSEVRERWEAFIRAQAVRVGGVSRGMRRSEYEEAKRRARRLCPESEPRMEERVR